MKRSIYIGAATAALIGMPGARLGAMTPAERAKGRYMRDGTGHPSGGTQLTPDQLVKQVNDALDAVKKIADGAEKEVKRIGGLTDETKAAADQALLKFNVLDELKARVEGLEQKHTGPGGAGLNAATINAAKNSRMMWSRLI